MRARPSRLSQAPIKLAIADSRGDVLGDVLSLGLLRNVLYRQIEARAPWGLDVKARPRALLYVVAHGTARLEVKGMPVIQLATGQAALLPRGAAHVLRDAATTTPVEVCDGPIQRTGNGTRRIGGRGAASSIITAFFELDRAPPPLLDRPSDVVLLAGDPRAAALIEMMLEELADPGPASMLLLQRLADVLVVHAMRLLSRQPACRARPRPGLSALADPPIHHALGLMHAEVGHAWSVGELAAKVGLSRSGFAARFAELVGEPPLTYLARWRVMRAAELLRDTDDPVSEIANRIGYQSTPSFNKAFKRWRGTSPGDYRRSLR